MTIRTNRAIGGQANSVNNAGLGLSSDRLPAYQTIHYVIDMSGLEANQNIVGYTNPPGGVALDVANGVFVSGDQYVVMALPPFTVLQGLQAICQTALVLGSGPAISIGDTSSATLFVNAASTLTAGTVLTQAITTNPLKFYATANTLLLQITGGSLASATGLLRLVITVADYTADSPTTSQ